MRKVCMVFISAVFMIAVDGLNRDNHDPLTELTLGFPQYKQDKQSQQPPQSSSTRPASSDTGKRPRDEQDGQFVEQRWKANEFRGQVPARPYITGKQPLVEPRPPPPVTGRKGRGRPRKIGKRLHGIVEYNGSLIKLELRFDGNNYIVEKPEELRGTPMKLPIQP